MNQVLFDLLDSCIVVYLDDILVFSRTKEDHEQDLDAVFKRLYVRVDIFTYHFVYMRYFLIILI